MSAIDEYAAYVKSCRTRGVLPCSLESFNATLRPDVHTWRERIGAAPTFPLHAPNDVERAMVAEIAELRKLAVSRTRASEPSTESSHQIVVGGQRVSMGVLLDLQRDAARYRWLRDKADSMACTAAPMVASLAGDGKVISLIDGEDLDAAVDIAMARPKARRAAGFIDLPSLAMLAAVGVLGTMAFTPISPAPQIPPAPAAVPGSGVSYAPYVFLDNDTGCQYLSTHNSTGLAPRMAADGKTHMGCKGSAQ